MSRGASELKINCFRKVSTYRQQSVNEDLQILKANFFSVTFNINYFNLSGEMINSLKWEFETVEVVNGGRANKREVVFSSK